MAATDDPSIGSILTQFVLPLDGVTQKGLAEALGVSRLTVNELLNDKRAITASMALRLSKALGTSAEFWMDIQRDVDLTKARNELSDVLNGVPVLRHPESQELVVVDFDDLFPRSPSND